ncbi:Na+/phosphate symporter [Halococcus thailandensis JCM 13552]|uniref:Na+/phosphate symporter n=1 Tax=Halococcus thailandensis JCM 13552 TaxID=1227457 RepID=M0NDV6_9EURY|nr:Na+/phosphate symporter [Halococcus thailandensis JCM 13552]
MFSLSFSNEFSNESLRATARYSVSAGSYVLANGSVIAALSLTLFNAKLVAATQLFVMIVGSRLGGAAVVVFLGVADYLNEEVESFSEATSLGLLTFLVHPCSVKVSSLC